MKADRWQVSATVWSLSDGFGWRLELTGPDTVEPQYHYGSQRTAVSRAVTPETVYDALKSSLRELSAMGKLPWLF